MNSPSPSEEKKILFLELLQPFLNVAATKKYRDLYSQLATHQPATGRGGVIANDPIG